MTNYMLNGIGGSVEEPEEDSIDQLVRDACSVVPVPKSEYRRRLEALIARAKIKARHNENTRAWGSVIGRNKDEQIDYFRIRAQKLTQPTNKEKTDDKQDL